MCPSRCALGSVARTEINENLNCLPSNLKELRNRPRAVSALRAKTRGRGYIPHPNKASGLKKLCDWALPREFETYRGSKQKHLKMLRLNAIRANLVKTWRERNYAIAISIVSEIPRKIFQISSIILLEDNQAITKQEITHDCLKNYA